MNEYQQANDNSKAQEPHPPQMPNGESYFGRTLFVEEYK